MSERVGYIYRVRDQDSTGVPALIERYVRHGKVFGGHIARLWPLRSFRTIADLEQDDLAEWDFGHAFGPLAEVRWRRVEDGSYDVLLLAEEPLAELAEAQQIGGVWRIRQVGEAARAILTLREGTPVRSGVGQVEYIAEDGNGAAPFVRYMEISP